MFMYRSNHCHILGRNISKGTHVLLFSILNMWWNYGIRMALIHYMNSIILRVTTQKEMPDLIKDEEWHSIISLNVLTKWTFAQRMKTWPFAWQNIFHYSHWGIIWTTKKENTMNFHNILYLVLFYMYFLFKNRVERK